MGVGFRADAGVEARASANSSLTAEPNELLTPWPSTATNVISERPIMSAPAVEAVRDGLRIAFCRAREPAEPPTRAPGAPSTERVAVAAERPAI